MLKINSDELDELATRDYNFRHNRYYPIINNRYSSEHEVEEADKLMKFFNNEFRTERVAVGIASYVRHRAKRKSQVVVNVDIRGLKLWNRIRFNVLNPMYVTEDMLFRAELLLGQAEIACVRDAYIFTIIIS